MKISFISPAPCMVTRTPVLAMSSTCSLNVTLFSMMTRLAVTLYRSIMSIMSLTFKKCRGRVRPRSRMVTVEGGLAARGTVMLSADHTFSRNLYPVIMLSKPYMVAPSSTTFLKHAALLR